MGKLKVSLWLLCLAPCILLGQLDRKARKQYEKYEELKPWAMQLFRYDTLLGMAKEIYELEAKCEKQDSIFLARMSAELGMLYGKKEFDWEASQQHYRAADIYEKEGAKAEAGKEISLYLYHLYWAKLNVIDDPRVVLDSSIYYNNNDTFIYKSLKARHFTYSADGDTVFVELYGGVDQGAHVGDYLDVRTTFDTFSGYDREIYYMGEGQITEVYPYTCKGYIALLEENKNLPLYDRDAWQIAAHRQKKNLGTYLYGMARFGIQFKSFYGTGYFTDGGALLDLDADRFEPCIKLAMLEDLKDLVKYYDTADPALISSKVEYGGPYKDQTWREVCLRTNLFDLKMFFAYLYAYPARSVNRSFSFVGQYVNWVNNGCSTGHVEELMTKLFFETPREKMMQDSQWWGGYYNTVEGLDSMLNVMIMDESIDLNLQQQIEQYEKFQALAVISGNVRSDSFFSYKLMWKYHEVKRYKEGLERGLRIWPITHGWHKSWTGLSIAQCYSGLDQDQRAVDYLDSALALDSSNTYLSGIKGWYLTKMGKFRDAYPLTKAAFESDSTEKWRVINFGHSRYIAGEVAEAEALYQKALGMITTASEFYSGFITDLDVFIKMGLMETQFKEVKARYIRIFNEKYKARFEADSVLKLAKHYFYDKHEYLKAVETYKQAQQLELAMPEVNYTNVRLIYRLTGYAHFKNKNYGISLSDGYLKGLEISKSQNLGPDFMISDYEDVAYLYGLNEEYMLEQEYESRQANLETVLREQREKKELYAVIIGNTGSEKNDEYADKDAEQFAKDLEDAALLHFDNSHIVQLIGKKATQGELINALDSVIYNSRENDIFIFYMAGNARHNDSANSIQLADGEYGLSDLTNLLKDIPAGRQLHIADCNGMNWREYYNKDNYAILGSDKMSLMFLGYSNVRIEEKASGHSVLAEALHHSFERSLEDGMATASEWLSNTSAELFKANNLYSFVNEAYGHDFVVGKKHVMRGLNDTSKPVIELFGATEKKVLRGGENVTIVNGSAERSGKISDESKIILATANGIPIKVAANGRFDLPRELLDTNMITIEAIDAVGLRGISVFQYQQNDKAAANESMRYAFLFASDQYKDWNDLHNPIFDAKEIGRILEENYGFKVEIIKDPTLVELKSKLLKIRKQNFKRQDQLFVFFAGHGLYDSIDGGGYYVCTDSKPSVEDELHDSYLSQGKVIELLNLTSCNNVFLAMDVCFGGKIFDKYEKHEYVSLGDGEDLTPEAFITRQLGISCRQFITSGGNNYVSDGGVGSHSPFARRFIQTLEKGAKEKKYITASDIMDALRLMKSFNNDKKSMFRYGSFGGDKDGEFVFKVFKPIKSSELANL